MSILKKGTDFGPTEQVTSTKLDNLVDNASFTDTSGNSVPYTGSTGTCLNGGGLEVTSGGQLQIQDAGVGTSELADTSVTTAKIASSAVTTAKIADANVTTAKIADSNVTTAKIANDAVTNAKIASTAVGTTELANSAVTTAKIANDAITSDKIANNAINSANMITGAVINTANIVDDAVTEDKLSASALTFIKSALYPVGSVISTTTNYADGAAVAADYGGTTWTRFSEGRMLAGYKSSDSDFSAGNEGGSKTVTLTKAQLPTNITDTNTKITFGGNGVPQFSVSGDFSFGGSPATNHQPSFGSGGTNPSRVVNLDIGGSGDSHDNMPPYKVVYMWTRTL